MEIPNVFRQSYPVQCALAICCILLASCASVGPEEAGPAAPVSVSWVGLGGKAQPAVPWEVRNLPGKKPTSYHHVRHSGRDAIQSDASGSASLLRQKVRVEPADLGRLAFSWNIDGLIEGADLTQREADDSPVRIVLAFDGDRSTFSPKNAMLSELMYTLSGEHMPYATLMYVWGNSGTPDRVIINTRTDRVRKIVLESGPARQKSWVNYERDIRADYETAFGEPPGALVGVAIMTDTDNSRQIARAWYGPITLVKPATSPSIPQR
ncbi:MAG: DUF3047 domain-containing protein [Polaromonas sp.]|nr:DUF3047 domain-containing protein [Polaromonas sp.]